MGIIGAVIVALLLVSLVAGYLLYTNNNMFVKMLSRIGIMESKDGTNGINESNSLINDDTVIDNNEDPLSDGTLAYLEQNASEEDIFDDILE